MEEQWFSCCPWSSLNASKLEELKGLDRAKRAVLQFAKPDSGVHAILLYGPRGSGKTALAHQLISTWLGEEGSPAVQAFANGRSADVLLVEPIGPSRIINVKQVTASRGSDEKFEGVPISEFLRTGPLISQKKVVLIHDAERMNAMAANALLKSLEEPGPFAKFILLTGSVGSILPTILSRCVAVACELPGDEEAATLGIDADLWIFAGGAPGRAKLFQEHERLYRGLMQFAQTLRNRPQREALVAAESLRGLAEDLQKTHDLNARAANAETLELLGTAVRNFHPDWDAPLLIAEAHRRILGNANPAFVFDSLMTRILA